MSCGIVFLFISTGGTFLCVRIKEIIRCDTNDAFDSIIEWLIGRAEYISWVIFENSLALTQDEFFIC